MVLRTINAVFDSKCIVCGTKIPKGEQSTYDTEKKKMYCRKCKAVAGTGAKRNDPIEDIIVKEIKDIPKDVKIEVRADLEKELGKIRTGADTIIGEFVTKMEKETPKHLKQARDEVSKMISKEFGTLPRCIIEIKSPDGKVKKIKEITHEKFSDIIKLINADVPVFLMGAAGCGKNHICKQVSEALGLEFYFTNAVSNEYKITGFIDANGKFHETQFYKAFTEGGLFFFDEIDASVPEVLVLLNAAIENRYFNFPTGKVNAHSNFRVIAAGNTYGSGASIQYVGRYQLDAASLDRFALIEIDYDDKVEMLISGNDKELVDFIHEVRKIVVKNGLRVVVSYRAINQIAKMVTGQGMSIETAVQYALVKGLNVDDMTIIKRNLPSMNNKYMTAYKQILENKINQR